MALLPWLKGKVVRIEKETDFTHRFWVEVQDLAEFDFKPGQFVTLDLPIDPKPTRRLRSYSIASWPDGTNVFELVIVLNQTGAGTQYIFNEIKVGSELTFRGPQGVFVLPEKLEKDIFLICTGTGVAPFRSMVHHIFNRNIAHKNIYLIFGTRTQQDMLYHQELTELQNKLTGFYYLPTLSREQWDGRTGYVHGVYEELCKDRPDAHFYLCGWKNMIDDARKNIQEMGYDRKAINSELYG
ncbi:MAG: FAD-dependent oxidoreductase [Bacteroidetes bacterium]|nr:FAD-dependent oxidoreductase [Bacteroidota bacterium]